MFLRYLSSLFNVFLKKVGASVNRNDLSNYQLEIEEYFDETKHTNLHNIFSSLEFKLNKNQYHFDNIKNTIGNADVLDKPDYYETVHLSIYYEMESFLVSLRSSVDVLLHLVNFSFDLEVSTNDVNLYNVFHHKKLPRSVKHIFERYTKPYNNPTWTFIYTSRNEIVHEKSVNLVLPIDIRLFGFEKPTVFFEWEENQREMLVFFNQCVRFLETFVTQCLQAIRISL